MNAMTSKSDESILDFTPDFKTIKKSAVNSILIQFFFKLKGIITMPIMTYFLLPEELGSFNLIIIAASLLTPFFSLNLTDGPAILMVQEKSSQRIRDMHSTVINSVLISFVVFSFVFYAVMDLSGTRYHQYSLLVIAVIFSRLMFKLFSYILAVFQKTSILVKNTFYKDSSAAILSVLLVVAGFSYYGMIYAVVVTELVASVFVYSWIKKDLPYRLYLNVSILKAFVRFALPLLPVFLFSWIIQSSDSYIIAYFKGEAAVGRYNIIYSLSNVILSLTFALNYFWFPVSARLWVDDREQYKQVFTRIFFAFSTVLLMIVVLFELNSKNILLLFAQNKEYQSAYIIMGTIAVAFAMQVLITLLTAPLYSNKNKMLISLAYIFGGVLNCVLNFILIPGYGIKGAAVSTALSYFSVVLIMSVSNYSAAGFRFIDKRLPFTVLLFLVFWPFVYYLRESLMNYQVYLANIPLLAIFLTLFFFLGLSSSEKDFIRSKFQELRKKG